MYFKNILVPYDESEHAKSALHIALGLAGPYPEARVSVLTVIASAALPNPTLLGDGGIGTPYAIADPATYERLMDSVVKNACADAQEIIDLVVMGRRGLGALRGMIGSVSFGVLRSVDVPVLTGK